MLRPAEKVRPAVEARPAEEVRPAVEARPAEKARPHRPVLGTRSVCTQASEVPSPSPDRPRIRPAVPPMAAPRVSRVVVRRPSWL